MSAARGPTAIDLAAAVRDRSRRAVEVVSDALERIERLDVELGAFREVHREVALARAEAIDRRIDAGEDVGPLAGVPIGLKDNIVARTGTTTAGSWFLEGYRSPFDATAVERLEAAGGVIVGRTSCDEFGMGSTNEHSAYGLVRNPWDRSRVAGGSSGGSAAAVAAGFVPGGSIRLPASYCGVVGIKPSYGRVSRWGLVAYGSSLDQIGPFAGTLEDAALVLRILAGHDPLDSTCADRHVPDYLDALGEHAGGELRIGVPRQHLDGDNHPQVQAALETAIATLRDAGLDVIELDLGTAEEAIATYYILATAEASSNLARYDGIRYGRRAEVRPDEPLERLYARSRSEGFGDEVKRRIMLGTYVLSAGYFDAYYRTALKARRVIQERYERAFERCDVLLGLTAPVPPPTLGALADPLQEYLTDVYTTGANIAGICGLSLPGAVAEIDGVRLPIGLQLQAPAFDEVALLRSALAVREAIGLEPLVPPRASG